MIPEPITIDGRPGTIVYLDAKWHPVPVAQATAAKVVFDDGGVAFYTTQSVAHIAKYDRAQPRDEDGKWTKDRNNLEQTHRIIQDYVSGSTYVNDTLRKVAKRHREDETWDQDEEIQALLGEKVALLDAQMQKNVLPEDTTLFRSVPNYVLGELKVGDVYQDDGYVSTTRNAANLQQIRQDIGARNEGNHSTVIVLAPKGLGHLNVNQELGQHVYSYQEEVVLPRGLRYQVVGLGLGHTLTVKVLP